MVALLRRHERDWDRSAAKNRQGSGDSVKVLEVSGWLRALALMVVCKVVLWVELWFVWSLVPSERVLFGWWFWLSVCLFDG